MREMLIMKYKELKRLESDLNRELGRLLSPPLTDLRQIKSICHQVRKMDLQSFEEKEICIAVVLRLYSPESLLSSKRVKRGITRELSQALQINYSYASNLTGEVRVRYQLIHPFCEKVDETALEVLKDKSR